MTKFPFKARLLARKVLPNRKWYPIEAWDDERYNQAFPQIKAQSDELEAQRIASNDSNGPVFSIIVPLFKTPRDYLDDMANSVLSQTYPNFELILVNASPELPDLETWINEYIAQDFRVKSVTLENNYGITENTNRGIEIATGDFICFMDHDDWIEPDTLFEFAAAVQKDSQIDLMYCDEDLVEKANGTWRYRHPLFKADFSPELLLCKNFVVHLLTVRKSLIDSLPTPRSEFDGAQDYNMTFMASEQARKIHHVSKVLYHWRMSEGSTAANSAAKPYGKRAYRLSAQRHLERMGIRGSIIGSGIVNIHTIWFKPETDKKVSLIIAHAAEQSTSFDACLESFAQTNSYSNVEILLVGNVGTTPKQNLPFSIHAVEASPNSSLLERFNAGARAVTGDVLVFLDSDCMYVTPEPLEQLLGLLSINGVGIAAPKTLYADYTVKSYGVGVSNEGVIPLYRGYPVDCPGYQCNLRAFQNMSAISYQGLTISRTDFEALEGFDEQFTAEIGAVDLCYRQLNKNKRIVAACTIELLTTEQAGYLSFDSSAHYPDYPQSDVEQLYKKHLKLKESTDSYRSPYLDLSSGYPVIRESLLK